MAKFCGECGTALPDGARFCAGCGASVDASFGGGPPAQSAVPAKGTQTFSSMRLEDINITGPNGLGIGATLCVLGAFVVPAAGNAFTGGIRLFSLGQYVSGIASFVSFLSAMTAVCALCAVVLLTARDKRPTSGSRLFGLVGGLAGVAGLLGSLILIIDLISGHWGAGVGIYMLAAGFLLCFAGGMSALSAKA